MRPLFSDILFVLLLVFIFMLVLILVFVLTFPVVAILVVLIDVHAGGGSMGEAHVAKAALDLYPRLSVAGLPGIVLVKSRAVLVVSPFSLLLNFAFAVVMEITEAGMDIDLRRKGLADDHPHS